MSWRSMGMLALLCALGCGGSEDEDAAATAGDTAVVVPRRQPLADGEAVGVLYSMSRGAADAAAAALPLVSVGELRRLLGVVRADHQALQAELRAIADSLKLTAVRHEAVGRVESAAQSATPQAAQLPPGGADEAVLRQQIRLHATLLAVLDSTVLPGLQPTLVAQYARAVRPAVAAHLQRAHQIEVLLRNRPVAAPPAAAPRTTAEPAPPAAAPATIDTTPPPAPPDTGRARSGPR